MGVFDFMTEKTEDDLECTSKSSCFVVLAICRTKKGFLQAFFFDADFFRFQLCESKHLDIVYTVFLLRSACPKGIVIYDYPENNPCALCDVENCCDCLSPGGGN